MKYLRVDKVDGKTYELDYEPAKEPAATSRKLWMRSSPIRTR